MHNTGHSRHWLLTSTPPPPREAGWMCGCGACVPCSVRILHSAPGNYCLHSIGRWRAGKGRSQRREALDRADAKRAKNTRDKGHGTHTARPVMIRVATACNPTREQGRGEARGPLVPRGCLAWEHRRGRGLPSSSPIPFAALMQQTHRTSLRSGGPCRCRADESQHRRRIPAVVIVFQSRVPRARVLSFPSLLPISRR